MDPTKELRQYFYLFQVLLGLTFVGIAWLVYRSTQSKSGFKTREADRAKNKLNEKPAIGAKAKPLLLPGVRIDGKPHEILGVQEDAPSEMIQEAYVALMKRFHPDRVGKPGSREWNDAQQIATAINQARNQMIENLKLRRQK